MIPKTTATPTTISGAISRILLLFALASSMPGDLFAQGTIAPSPFQTVFDNAGKIVNNACVWTYVAGTSTPVTTYTDSALTIPNLNPIRTDSAGRFTAYLTPGSAYKFSYEGFCVPPSHGTTLRTADSITAVPANSVGVDVLGTAGEAISANQVVYLSDGSGSKIAGQWYKADPANAYSATLPTIGIATAGISATAIGTVRLAGSVTGFTALTVGSGYYVSTSGAITTTAPSARRFLGVADTTSSLVLNANPPLLTAVASGSPSSATFYRGDQTWASTWTVVTTTLTGLQTGSWVTLAGNTVIHCNNASTLTIAGLPAGTDGQLVQLRPVNAQVDLAHSSGSETAPANRLINMATSGNTSIVAGIGSATYQYDGTTQRWRLVAHEQGGWITPTYAAGDYTATGGGTFTVDSGDVTTYAYYLSGRRLMVAIDLATTTTAGTITACNVKVPGGFTAAKQITTLGRRYDTGGGTSAAVTLQVASAGTVLKFSTDLADFANSFGAFTNTFRLGGEIVIEVQ